jgi:hypothetical protein
MQNTQARFDYLLNTMLNSEEAELQMELSAEEKEFSKSVDLEEVLFI